MRIENGNIIASEQDILNAVVITKTLAQILQDTIDCVDSSEADIFQKIYCAVNDGRFDMAIDKVIAHLNEKGGTK